MKDASVAPRTAFLPVGANNVTIFGLSPVERARRFALQAGLEPVTDMPAAGPAIVADLDFAWDPAWLGWVKAMPGRGLRFGGRTVLGHYRSAGAELTEIRDADAGTTLYNEVLRKRQEAYVLPLIRAKARIIEKASYDGAYKGVTDLLTLYLWRGIAFHLTRWAAMLGLSPNVVSAVGVAACIWTFFLFRDGWFWAGIAVGLVFMVLDTVDGKLARCTGTSSAVGNVIDHGIDLIHPPFWYWAWGVGLVAWGQPMARSELGGLIAVIIAGYVVQRLIEGWFIYRFGGIHIHVWERIDSRFRLVTARRNPNMVILFFALLLGQPRAGLVAVMWWTVLSCLFHLVRLAQAEMRRAARRPVTSWLVEG